MSKRSKLDKILRRYRSRLAHLKRLIKDAEREFKAGRISKKKCAKLKLKYENKKDLVISKMKKTKLKIQK